MYLRDVWMVPLEYIRDKNHVRMNATKWVTLSGFCKYLGSSGQCKIDETEKGNSYRPKIPTIPPPEYPRIYLPNLSAQAQSSGFQ